MSNNATESLRTSRLKFNIWTDWRNGLLCRVGEGYIFIRPLNHTQCTINYIGTASVKCKSQSKSFVIKIAKFLPAFRPLVLIQYHHSLKNMNANVVILFIWGRSLLSQEYTDYFSPSSLTLTKHTSIINWRLFDKVQTVEFSITILKFGTILYIYDVSWFCFQCDNLMC